MDKNQTFTSDVAARGTDTATQEARIIEALRASPKTTDDLRRLGAYQVSARIFGLRKRGFDIETTLYDGWSADGFRHKKMARYQLLSEPKKDESRTCADAEGP